MLKTIKIVMLKTIKIVMKETENNIKKMESYPKLLDWKN